MKYALSLGALFVALMITEALFLPSALQHGPGQRHSDLADRVNHACKSGYQVNDWTVGDNYDPVPAGTVKVTCVRATAPYDLYYAAVAR